MKKSIFVIFPFIMGCVLLCGCASMPGGGGANPVGDDSPMLYRAFDESRTIEDAYVKSAAVENIAQVYSTNGQYDQAIRVAEAIEISNMEAVALMRISRQALEAGHTQKAEEILALAGAAADKVETPHIQACTLAMLAAEYTRMGRKETAVALLDRAFELSEPLEDIHIKAYNFTVISGQYAKAGEKEKAGETLTMAFELSQLPEDAEVKITVLDRIAGVLAEDKQYEKAFEVSDAIEDAITKDAAPGRIAEAYATTGNYDKAVAAAQTVETPYARAMTLTGLAVRAWNDGLKEKGLEIMDRSVEAADLVADVENKGLAQERIVDAYMEIFQWQGAVVVAKSIEHPVRKDAAKERVIRECASLEWCDEALPVADEMENPFHKALALKHVAVGMHRKGRDEKAGELLSRALQEAKLVPDPIVRQVAVVEVSDGYSECNLPERGIEIAETVDNEYYKDTALYGVANRYVKTDQFDPALAVVDDMVSPYYRASIITRIAARQM